MRVESLKFRNFRNIEEIALDNFSGMNVICGENAQGKTNFLEGIWLFTGVKSFRPSPDRTFVKFGCEKARLEMSFTAEGTKTDAAISIDEHRTAFINGKKLKSAAGLAGNFNAIVFSPTDLELVSGGPAARRKFLDIAIGQLYPGYINILKSYIRSVTQRNRIIKDLKYDGTVGIMLDVFENEAAVSGGKIISYRKRFIELICKYLPEVYGGISSGKEELACEYKATSEAERLKESYLESRREDMYTGTTSVGPHRDDVEFKINGISARVYGSQGQKRSVALSIKLAQAEIFKKTAGEYPVFLLDDVMSELDPERQNYILNHIKGIQSFITCCDPSNVERLKEGRIINIANGSAV